ncbi:MAG: 30S ribosomal protein S6 [Nitrospirota bacterium]|nr:30S ribosomal protein S6 [Nitrospirota bacterium]MDH5768842.1 30S ribosomal protein S6 [Nitrospirota bacterium]
MNTYENIVIMNASLTDEEIESAITRIKDLISGYGGQILKVDVWGKKKLAYEIKKQKKGVYVLFLYKTASSTVKKLEDFYRVFDAVIKYMIVKLSIKQAQDLEKVEVVPEPTEPKIKPE